jgi:excisionase family DNA binding protein
MADDLMTKEDLMAYLKISLPTVNRLMVRGLPYIKLAEGKGHVLFRRKDIDKYLEARLVKPKKRALAEGKK